MSRFATQYRRNQTVPASFIALAILAACGGGGGGGASPIPPAPTDGVSVAGIIKAADSAQIDGDTNTSAVTPIRNNDFNTAQSVPNQFRLGGYVNLPGSGPDGPLRAGGDEFDVFNTVLIQGQFINLYIGDVNNGDLDLALFDVNGVLVEISESATENVESVPVPTSGTYFIAVRAFSGSGNYVLAAGSNAAAQHAMRSDADLIPGQVIVDFEQSPQTAKLGGTPAAKAAALGMQWLGGGDGQPMLFGFNGPQQKALARAALGLPATRAKSISAALDEKLETLSIAKVLSRQAGVRYAEPVLRRHIQRVPNDPAFATQWHYSQINLPQAWDVTVGSADVLVAVIDTGVLVQHPDLVANLDSNDPNGFDFISDVGIANDGNGRDGNADDAGDEADPDGGASFHGTHCAGTIAARGDNGEGVTGVNWVAQIMPLRALGVGGGTSFDVLQAMLYAAGLPNASSQLPAKRADIISMSLGGSDASQAEQDIVDRVRAEGVIIIAAAGNSGNSTLEFPASYDGVVSVAATNITRNRAFYSQFNSQVDVAAPGGDVSTDVNGDGVPDGVLSTFGNGAPGRADFEFSFRTLMGTSMATPHMAGVVALMKAVHPGLTPAQLDTALAAGELTDDLGAVGRDNNFGNGLINAAKSVATAQRLASGQPPPVAAPVLVANPDSVNFGSTRTTIEVSLANGGGGVLTVTAVTDDQPWLTVAPATVAADGTGIYRFTVNRSGLAPGLYAGTVTATSSANTRTIQVSMEVAGAGASTAPTAGFLFLLLIDTEAAEGVVVVDQVNVAPVNGQYPFEFKGVRNGRYIIVAGTDSDNDDFICDEGEACGVFPTDNEDFTVNGAALSGILFPVSFEVGVSTSSVAGQAGRKGFRRE